MQTMAARMPESKRSLMKSSSNSNTVELVIFDCDGVLVDSERISHLVLTQMLGVLHLLQNIACGYAA